MILAKCQQARPDPFFFCRQVEGFRNRQLRPLLAQVLGLKESDITQGRMSYELRRLRLHGLIERIPKSHRYRLTRKGIGAVTFSQRLYARMIRPAFSVINGGLCCDGSAKAKALAKMMASIDDYISLQAA